MTGRRRHDGGALDVFERQRPQLLGLAYRMLGIVADAEDVVQESWLRWQATDATRLKRPAAWLTTARRLSQRCHVLWTWYRKRTSARPFPVMP